MGCLLENKNTKNDINTDVTTKNDSYSGKARFYYKRMSVRFFIAIAIIVITFVLCFGIFLSMDLVKGANVIELMAIGAGIGLIFALVNFFTIEKSKLLFMDDRILVYRTCGTCNTYLLDNFSRVYTKRIFNGGDYIGKTQYLCFSKYRKNKKVGEKKLNLGFLKQTDISNIISEVYRICRPHIANEYNALNDKGFKKQYFSFNRMTAVNRINEARKKMIAFYIFISILVIFIPVIVAHFVIKLDLQLIYIILGISIVVALMIFFTCGIRSNIYKKMTSMTPTMFEIKEDWLVINSEEFLHKASIKFVNITPSFMDTLTMIRIKSVYGNIKFYVDASEGNNVNENNRLISVLEFWCDFNQITYNEGE